MATLKADYRKGAEQGVLLDGLQRLITQISGQNVDNMNKYTENMTTLVTSIKDTFKKDESQSPASTASTVGATAHQASKSPYLVEEHVTGDIHEAASNLDEDQ